MSDMSVDQMANFLGKYVSFHRKETNPADEDIQLKIWMRNVLELCRNAESLERALLKIEPRKNEYSSNIKFQDEVPYLSLLSAFVYFKWGQYADSAKYAKYAVDEFKARQKNRNRALALCLRAYATERDRHIEDALKDIEEASLLVADLLSKAKKFTPMAEMQPDYEAIAKQLRELQDRLQRQIRSNVSNIRPAPPPPAVPPVDHQPPPPPSGPNGSAAELPKIEVKVPIDITLSNSVNASLSTQSESVIDGDIINTNMAFPEGSNPQPINISSAMPQPLEIEEITLPWLPLLVHPTAHANPYAAGQYIVESDEELPTEISHIRIENQVCEIHLVKNSSKIKDHLARLISSRNYKWMKVSGDSMKDFDPGFDDGDYVLFYNLQSSSLEDVDYDLVYQDGVSGPPAQRAALPDDNVVIVRQVDELTNEPRLLIKSYKSSENLLYSYNEEKKYQPVPLCEECQIIGVVVAIAKPPRKEEEAS